MATPIFQDENGVALKFFLQNDIPEELQKELVENITLNGGRVEAKVPIQGFIVVSPGTTEAERLRACWQDPGRPCRYFVPYTYIEACKTAGTILKQIFTENGVPIPFHIHPSIANPNVRNALSQRIVHSGGDPSSSAQSARIILADPSTDVFQELVKVYQDKRVESYLWVKNCVDNEELAYTPLVYKNPGGRRPGEERTNFTEEDDIHLCQWIAEKIPYKETGGRTGNKLYRQLCEKREDAGYTWVSRHTWQSWRERYKKNADRLDNIINKIVDETKPEPGQQGQYGYVRMPEVKQKKPRKQRTKKIDSSEPPGSTQDSVPGTTTPNPVFAVTGYFPQVTGEPSSWTPVHRNPVDDMDEDNEWRVKVGDAPPPTWSKRKSSDDDEEPHKKRAKTLTLEHPRSIPESSGLHVVDQAIQDIAKEFRFTTEEVQEYYDKCGEMTKTRNRFRKIRERISQMESDGE